jgi:uncharacterized cupin superfamily protein
VKRVNLDEIELAFDDDDPDGFHAGYVQLAPFLGASRIGATLYELPPGQSNCPYHYEYGNEEWLLVLCGELTVRTPDGEHALGPGDVACFPEGPVGAHRLTNNGEENVRALMLSTRRDPAIAVYPDSAKIGVYPGPTGKGDRLLVRRESAVDYWDGETA